MVTAKRMPKVYSQNNNFVHVLSSHSFVHFFAVTDDCDMKMHHFTFLEAMNK